MTASLNLLNLYHDTLLHRRVAQLGPKHKPILPPSAHTRYTRAWCDKSSTYKWAARMLDVLRFTELLIEMAMRRKLGQKARWRGIVLLELLKYVISLLAVSSSHTIYPELSCAY